MAQGNPMPGEQYLHFKNRRYQVIAVAYHSETLERYVVYQALYGDFKIYVRPYDMFISEVDHEKYPEVKQKYRFQYLEAPSTGEWKAKASDRAGNSFEAFQKATNAPAMEQMKDAAGDEGDSRNPVTENKVPGSGAEADMVQPIQRAAVTDETANAEEGHLNPWLDKILDATSFDEKYNIVCDMQSDITDKLIDDIAVVMDIAIPEGNLRERYAQLKYCLRTRQKYESGRLW